MKKAGKSFADEGTSEEAAQKEYRAIAERRVRLGLVLGTLGEKEGIQVNEQELQQALMSRARQFPGQEKQVFDHYRKNPNALIELRGPVFEQKVVDFLVSKAKVTDKSVSHAELQAMVQDDDEDHSGHDHDHGITAMTMTTRTKIPCRSQAEEETGSKKGQEERLTAIISVTCFVLTRCGTTWGR